MSMNKKGFYTVLKDLAHLYLETSEGKTIIKIYFETFVSHKVYKVQ